MKATRDEVVAWAQALADIAAKLGAATVDKATLAEQQALEEATAEAAHAALILERAFGGA